MLAHHERYPRPYAAIRKFGFRLERLEPPVSPPGGGARASSRKQAARPAKRG
jgi:hypothetical protein